MSDKVQGKQSSREKHFSCSKAPVKRPLESITVPSSKFFTARAGFRLALVSFRTRAKRGIAETGGGPNRARAPPAVARNRRVCG